MHYKLQGHAIFFAHDAPVKAVESINGMLQQQHIEDLLCLQFIGPEGKMDHLIGQTLGTSKLFARPYVILQHLLVYRETNPQYRKLPIVCEENLLLQQNWTRFQMIMEQAKNAIIDSASQVTDKELLDYEQSLGANIAGTSWQQHSGMDSAQGAAGLNPDEERAENTFRHSSVTNKPFVAPAGKTCEKQVEAMAALLLNSQLANKAHASDAQPSDGNNDNNDDGLPPLPSLDELVDQDNGATSNMSQRASNPFADAFGDSNDVICAAFPHVFITGKAYGRALGALTTMQATHLLTQFH
jgi:hypothetical protein